MSPAVRALGSPGTGSGPRCGRLTSGGCTVGPPMLRRQVEQHGAGCSEPLSQKKRHDNSDHTDYLPPVRHLDATECFWNAFLRLGNLAIVNCVAVVSSHPIELETLRHAATIVARRNQALRLVIRLTDTKAVAQHQARQQQEHLVVTLKSQQPLQQQASSEDLLREESVSKKSEGLPNPSGQSFHTDASCHNTRSSCNARGSSCNRGIRAAWGWSSRRCASQVSRHSFGNINVRSSVRSSSCSIARDSNSDAERNLGERMSFPLPCRCRKRADAKFTFHERPGEPVIDVDHATVKDSISSSGLAWQQHELPQLDLGLLEEHPWMKAMAWEQKIPFNCEEGPLWRLRMLPSEEELTTAADASLPLPTPQQIGRALERTHTSSITLSSSQPQQPKQRSSSNKGHRRFRTHIIGVFHHSTIDGLSRKEFWDELFKCITTLSNSKQYAEYASRVKALTAVTAVAAQLSAQCQQESHEGGGPLHQQGCKNPASAASTAMQTPTMSPVNRWRRGSSNSTSTDNAGGGLYLRRSSAGSTCVTCLPLLEFEHCKGPLDSPTAHSSSYIRRLSAVSAGSVDRAAVYAREDTTQNGQDTTTVLPPPPTVLPPALNELFRVSRCVSLLRPLMYPGGGFHVRMYMMERQLMQTLRNPFASYYPSARFRASGSEYKFHKDEVTNPAFPNCRQQQLFPPRASRQVKQQHDVPFPREHSGEPKYPESSAFTGVITLRLSQKLTSGLLSACKEKNMTMNGLITTAAAVALSRMLWRRQHVMQQHCMLADLSRVAAAAIAANCWPQQHQSLWDAAPQNQQDRPLLKPVDEETPQGCTKGTISEQENPSPNVTFAHAGIEQDTLGKAQKRQAQMPMKSGALLSPNDKGSTSLTEALCRLQRNDTSLAVGKEIQRLPSIQELLTMPQRVGSGNKGPKGLLSRSVMSRRNATTLRSGWSLSHIPEMLQQLTLRSPVSGEGLPGDSSRHFFRHKGPVYIYTLQAISGRRWLDSWLHKQQQYPDKHSRGRKRNTKDDRHFEEFLLQHLTISMKRHKCSRSIAAMAAASAAMVISGSPSAASLQTQSPRYPPSLLWGSSSSSSRSTSGSRISSDTQACQQRNTNEAGSAGHHGNEAFFKTEQPQRHSSGVSADEPPAIAVPDIMQKVRRCRDSVDSEKVPEAFSKPFCKRTCHGFLETSGHSSVSTCSSLYCTRASTISADSIEETDKSSVYSAVSSTNSTSCSKRLRDQTHTVSSRISRGLRQVSQWLWGAPSSSTHKQSTQIQQQHKQLPPFGLGSYALLMPLKLRVSVECDEGADAVWALGKACTDSVQEFASLTNPSFGTLNFQLISSFVEEVRGELKCLRPFKDDAFARPSVFLISNGGVWTGGPISKFSSEIHGYLRAATDRHRRMLRHMLHQQMVLQQKATKRQVLSPLPPQFSGVAGAPDASLRNKRQGGGRRSARSSKIFVRADAPPAASIIKATASRNSSVRSPAADVKLSSVVNSPIDKQQYLKSQPASYTEGICGVEGLVDDLDGLLPYLEPFDISIDSSWSIVSQHDTGLNYFAHNCVTIDGKLNWSLQYHSNLTSREIAALYAAYILEVLQEAHEQHIHMKAQQQQHQQQKQQYLQAPPPSAAARNSGIVKNLGTVRD
ncbi:uncharacterized protein LOC34624006 [Cyclospora cayetanensis]|uniref:Uncharacterized protein LOC34624006 n=1 Tax=Cyclospora cayetanensis TaxID=88456 RepID=A0A6P6S2C7_9EIME|nr:uncharacterized protein LOC34624006 [Cyclospora cayetanensis]